MPDQNRDDDPTVTAAPGYALGQLARALSASETHKDPVARERARQKAAAWTQVYAGMLSGALTVGSRTPVRDTPGWATLEVAQGGFATGALLAAGPLRPHEQALLDTLAARGALPAATSASGQAAPREESARALLNGYYLSEDGFAELRERLKTGCYRVEVPEEGALLVVAWLADHGHADEARAVLDAIAPMLSRLRFYPVPSERPLIPSAFVHVQTVKETVASLDAMPQRLEPLAQREALTVWNPLMDRAVALFLETVRGEVPAVAMGADGRPLRRADQSWALSGGWPCQVYPDGWRERAQALLRDLAQLRARHRLCSQPESKKANLARLCGVLARCVADPRALDGREVGTVRMILAHVAAKRGLPGSERSQARRAADVQHAARPTKKELARVLTERLRACPQDAGIDALEPLLTPVSAEESARHQLPPGVALHPALRARLLACLDAPIEAHVQSGVIPSGEVLARVVPQLTAQVSASGIADPDLRRLYGAIYEAFRRRRSLLLLNLEHQIRIGELPWVAALTALQTRGQDVKQRARAALEQLVLLALTAFPQSILPNKLLQEIRALAERAGLALPIVDEIAADIFMGAFTEKYLRAAQQAGALLRGTLYETYYALPYDRVARQEPVKGRHKVPPTVPAFYDLCVALAGESAPGGHRAVAHNGRILEQEQILTTHNLAVLVGALDLTAALRPQIPDLVRACFGWICKQQQLASAPWRTRLHRVKNGAYALRQMIFFLSLLPKDAVRGLLAWAERHLAEQTPAFQGRFRPVIAGLHRAASGQSPDAPPASRRFLGWAADQSWLLPEQKGRKS